MKTVTANEEVMNNSKPVKHFFQVRYYIAIIGALTTLLMFASRSCLNVAIVSMTATNDANKTLSYSQNETLTIKPLTENFHWTASQQGIVLGAYFYGYTVFQVPTGILADKINVVSVSIVCNIIVSALTATIPMAARAGVAYISIVRTMIGVVHAPILSLILVLASKWFPPDEVVLPISLLNFGSNIGNAIIMPFSAWLCTQTQWGGWPMVFYSIAIINLIIPIIWFFTVTPIPDTHPFISKYEVDLINKANSNIGNIKMKIPWLAIFSSMAVWAIIASKGCLAVGYAIINTKIPAYLESELGMDLSSNGSFNSYLYIAIAATNISTGPLFKYFIDKGWVARTAARKIAEVFTILLPACALLSIPFIGKDVTMIKILLIVSMFLIGFQSAADWPIVSEVAPDLAGCIFGITNTVGASTGFIAPAIIGALLDSGLYHTQAWNILFYLGAGVMFFGGTIFIIFAKTDPEPWGIAPSRSMDNLDTATDFEKRLRAKKIRIHPVFSRQGSIG